MANKLKYLRNVLLGDDLLLGSVWRESKGNWVAEFCPTTYTDILSDGLEDAEELMTYRIRSLHPTREAGILWIFSCLPLKDDPGLSTLRVRLTRV